MSKTKEDDKITIKPCPYGCESNLDTLAIVGINKEATKHAVTCKECLAFGPVADDKVEAVSKWNVRHIVIVSKENYEKLTEGAEDVKEESKEG
jgi:hypothetical protein